jgi:hypothetical protein
MMAIPSASVTSSVRICSAIDPNETAGHLPDPVDWWPCASFLEEWLPGDLGATIEVPRCTNGYPKPLEAGDRDQLLGGAHPRHPGAETQPALILLLLSTGARNSEVLVDRSEWKPERL